MELRCQFLHERGKGSQVATLDQIKLIHEVNVVVETEAERTLTIAAGDDVAVAIDCCRLSLLLAPDMSINTEHTTKNGLGLYFVI